MEHSSEREFLNFIRNSLPVDVEDFTEERKLQFCEEYLRFTEALSKTAVEILRDTGLWTEKLRRICPEMQQGEPLDLYCSEVDREPAPGLGELAALAASLQNGDRTAKERLIKGMLRLSIFLSARYYYGHLPVLDLIQAGNDGLMEAVGEIERGSALPPEALIAYAVHESILKAERDAPHEINRTFAEYMVCSMQYFMKHRREPSEEEIASLTGLDPETICAFRNRPPWPDPDF